MDYKLTEEARRKLLKYSVVLRSGKITCSEFNKIWGDAVGLSHIARENVSQQKI